MIKRFSFILIMGLFLINFSFAQDNQSDHTQEIFCSISPSTADASLFVIEVNGKIVSPARDLTLAIATLRDMSHQNYCTRVSESVAKAICESFICGAPGTSCILPCHCNGSRCDFR